MLECTRDRIVHFHNVCNYTVSLSVSLKISSIYGGSGQYCNVVGRQIHRGVDRTRMHDPHPERVA